MGDSTVMLSAAKHLMAPSATDLRCAQGDSAGADFIIRGIF
jgi:hypothetical protein